MEVSEHKDTLLRMGIDGASTGQGEYGARRTGSLEPEPPVALLDRTLGTWEG